MKRNRRNLLVAVGLLWAGVSCLEAPLSAAAARSSWMAARQTGGSPAMAQMAGSFRVVAANVLWMKVNDYHHEAEERGVVWTTNDELLPLLRAITYLDPHFTEAYQTHSIMLTAQGHLGDSRKILEEGLRNNPNRPEMYISLGLLYGLHFHQLDRARDYFAQALVVTKDPDERHKIERSLRNLDARIAAGRDRAAAK